ncbi:cytochrome P450 [Variovorax sp. J22R133]|uniref:cytochrome P450 n=1 Tax=Variovorax brevis TaxID=3053503 RepID=UPI002577F755|nr:cytochrome P450 [Variovorax sp. J22R133]MDM0114726.1 cytochrome P450 [Variovorax sp. J22R133]
MNDASLPRDPIAAVTHADPYPYYAGLRDGPPLIHDAGLGLWVASRAEVVAEALNSRALRVRPVSEPVPKAIAGTTAGNLFAQWVRMNDGPLHTVHKPVLQQALAGIDRETVRATARRVAEHLEQDALDDWCFALPVCTVAALLGFDDDQLPHLAAWTRDFVACLTPLSTPAQLRDASQAGDALLARFDAMLEAPRAGSLMASARDEARRAPSAERRVLLANLVGLLSQTCDATAGLLGNCIVALKREPGLLAAFAAGQVDTSELVAEVARHDPSTHNTRRFVAEGTTLAGTPLAPGDAVLLILAAANRDEALNPLAERFELARAQRKMLGFGHGPHACPGQALAFDIAGAALESLRDSGMTRADKLPPHRGYRPSINVRIPFFGD